MPLNPLDVLNGTFNLILVSVSVVLGLIVLKKYFTNKNKNFIFSGLTMIFISTGWWGTSASFIVALLFNSDGLSLEMIMLLNFIPLPIGLFAWITFYTNLLAKDKKKLLFGFITIVTVIFYVLFLVLLFTNSALVAEKISPVDTAGTNWTLIVYIVIYIVLFVYTGTKFSLATMKYENLETRLKGKFLIFAFPSFAVGAFLDASMPTAAITLIVFRLILIASLVAFYCGFLLPESLKRILIKEGTAPEKK